MYNPPHVRISELLEDVENRVSVFYLLSILTLSVFSVVSVFAYWSGCVYVCLCVFQCNSPQKKRQVLRAAKGKCVLQSNNNNHSNYISCSTVNENKVKKKNEAKNK